MKCKRINEIFDYFGPDTGNKDGILVHKEECAECAQVFNFLKSLRELPKKKSPQYITDNVMKKLKNESNVNSGLFNHGVNEVIRPLVPMVAGIFILLVLVLSSIKERDLVKVTFKVPISGASAVSLVGDFNNWNPSKGNLKRIRSGWKGTFYVKPGRYQYMLIIDGKQWIPDPSAEEFLDDGYGNKNSLINVTRI